MEAKQQITARIRSARTSLEQAERSFRADREVRGELDLMLAEAELQNLRNKRQGAPIWTRRLLAGVVAVLVLLGGYGGYWYAAHRHAAEASQVTDAAPPLGAVEGGAQPAMMPQQVQTSAAAESASQRAAPAAGATPQAAAEVRAAQKLPPAEAGGTAENTERSQTMQVPAQPQEQPVMSPHELRQLVRTGRQELNR